MRVELRRTFLTKALALFGASRDFAVQAPISRRLKVVVAGGHPGDPEYGCGGTVAKYVALGHQVTLLYLNRGEKGCTGQTSEACASVRTSEAIQACKLLGSTPVFFDQMDGEANVNAMSYDKFHSLLKTQKPDVVFTHWPLDNHRDHRAITNFVYDAWKSDKKSYALYFYEVSDGEDTAMFSPTDYVDIGTTESTKRAACFAHASQSPNYFYPLQAEITRFRGIESGHAQAEAFIRERETALHLLP